MVGFFFRYTSAACFNILVVQFEKEKHPENIKNIKEGRKLRKFRAVKPESSNFLFLLLPYANNKGADQPAHTRSLISAFAVRCLDNIIPLVSISEISSLYVSSLAVCGLCLTWLQTLKTGFLVTRLICIRFSVSS